MTFNEEKAYDPRDLDLGEILRQEPEDIIQKLEINEWGNDEDGCQNKLFIEKTSNPVEPIKLDRKEEISVEKKMSMKTSGKMISSDIDVKNILPGKRTRNRTVYTTFHNSFAVGHKNLKTNKLHRTELPPPPKNYKEALRHKFSIGFIDAEKREYNTLINKELFPKISKQEIDTMRVDRKLDSKLKTLPLMWVYTYKFDVDGYLHVFKARLVARGDFKITTEETYAATLAAQVFKAAMTILAAFGFKYVSTIL